MLGARNCGALQETLRPTASSRHRRLVWQAQEMQRRTRRQQVKSQSVLCQHHRKIEEKIVQISCLARLVTSDPPDTNRLAQSTGFLPAKGRVSPTWRLHKTFGGKSLALSALDFIGGADADRTRDLLNAICVRPNLAGISG